MRQIVLLRSPRPAAGQFHGATDGFGARRILNAFIEDHNDVRAQCQLNLDRAFRREEMRGAVQVRSKPYPILSHPRQAFKAHHLEPAAICQNGTRPGHEPVQPPCFAHDFVAGAQVKMIGVSQQHLDAQFF